MDEEANFAVLLHIQIRARAIFFFFCAINVAFLIEIEKKIDLYEKLGGIFYLMVCSFELGFSLWFVFNYFFRHNWSLLKVDYFFLLIQFWLNQMLCCCSILCPVANKFISCIFAPWSYTSIKSLWPQFLANLCFNLHSLCHYY